MKHREKKNQDAPEKPEQALKRKQRVFLIVLLVVLAGAIASLLIWFAQLPPDAEIKQLFASREALRSFLRSFGWWAPALFVLLQASQVIFSPIPGSVTTLAGGLIFGIGKGFVLSSAGIVVGSLIAFALARFCGQRVVIFLLGQAHFEQYSRFWTGKRGLSLLILFVLPFFPDDILCFLAGLSFLPWRVFLLFLLIGRLPTIFLTTLIGAGVLSFSLWEWIIIGLLALGMLMVFFKYGDAFERRVQHIMQRGESRKKERSDS